MMLYGCTHVATVGVKALVSSRPEIFSAFWTFILQPASQLLWDEHFQVGKFQSTPDLVVRVRAERIKVEAHGAREQYWFLPQHHPTDW